MIDWETLTITVTSANQFERIFMLTSFNILIIFISTFIIAGWIESLDKQIHEKTNEEEKSGKISKERINRIRNIIFTIGIILMAIVSAMLIREFKDKYYDIKVAVTPKNIIAQDLDKIKFNENKFLDLFQQFTPDAKAIYYPTTTKLLKEDNQVYFITRLLKDSYKNYKIPEEFQQDIEKILNKTIEDTEEQLATRPELMAKFTEEHLIKGK